MVEIIIPIPAPVPGIRLGLSNIVVMFALFFLKWRIAFSIAVLKSMFVFITRGAVAGTLSLSGGVLSILIMTVLLLTMKNRLSWLLISIAGAVSTTSARLPRLHLFWNSLWFYLPFLLLFGIIAGSATSVLLKVSIPVFKSSILLLIFISDNPTKQTSA